MARALSVLILTYNEEGNLPACLESICALDAEMFVVDSGSADGTRDIARAAGCRVVEHSWETYAAQFNWALDHLPISTPWVMRLDADERLMWSCPRQIGQVAGWCALRNWRGERIPRARCGCISLWSSNQRSSPAMTVAASGLLLPE